MTQEYDKEMAALRHDVKELREDLTNLVKDLKVIAGKGGAAAKEEMQARLNRGLDWAKESLECARETGQKAAQTIHHTMEERPVATVLTVLAAGFLLGAIARRKSA
jgi:ElaB/YqjD/DUF883 family membrane-anchored ribosome-binding protein